MAAYVIISIRAVHDPGKFHQYGEGFDKPWRNTARRMIATGKVHVLEGDWRPVGLAVYEFDSLDVLQTGYASEECQPLKRLRPEVIDVHIVIDEGL